MPPPVPFGPFSPIGSSRSSSVRPCSSSSLPDRFKPIPLADIPLKLLQAAWGHDIDLEDNSSLSPTSVLDFQFAIPHFDSGFFPVGPHADERALKKSKTRPDDNRSVSRHGLPFVHTESGRGMVFVDTPNCTQSEAVKGFVDTPSGSSSPPLNPAEDRDKDSCTKRRFDSLGGRRQLDTHAV